MSILDFVCVGIYFILVAAIAAWASRESQTSSRSYFLGGKHVSWIAIGASLFATNVSAEHFIGLAGTGASSGLAVGQFEWLACLILILLGWFFVPFYLKTGVFTMPEFLERRFDARSRRYLSVVSLIAYVFTKVSVAVYAGAIVLKTILGWNIWVGAVSLIVVTGLYTITGGLRAVIYTDYFQALVLIAGGFILTFKAVSGVGGLDMLVQKLEPSFFNLWRDMSDPEFPWTGILFGAPILGIWYWCTDQVIVQRTLASESIDKARKACVLAGFLKILPVFILVLPGLAGRLLFPETNPNEIYATMVTQLLPPGIKGVVVAGLLAALMSSLSSVFNSSSTIVVMDFYKKRKPHATEKDLVRAGQVATGVLVVSSLLWLPFIGIMSNQLYVYLQSVQAYISPPIASVFLVGLLWKRANGHGAIAALLSGFVLGSSRFVCEIGMKAGWITNPALKHFTEINFLHFALMLFVVSTFILVAVSLSTKAPAGNPIESLVKTGHIPSGIEKRPAFNAANFWAFALVASVLACWLYFSPVFFH